MSQSQMTMRKLRYCPGPTLFEVTCRTLQGRFLFKPTPAFNREVRGVLGRGLKLYAVQLHAYVMMSNHYHMILTAPNQQTLSRFLGHFHSGVARVVDRVNPDWSGKVWGKRSNQIAISAEPEAQIARLRYVLSHGCKERLVASPRRWPGISSTLQLLGAGPSIGTWRDRGALSDARNNRSGPIDPTEFDRAYPIALERLPCWREYDSDAHKQLVEETISGIENEFAVHQSEEGESTGRLNRVFTADSRACRPKPARRSLPFVHAASRLTRQFMRATYVTFLRAYREAASRLARGEQQVVFPFGCIPPRPPPHAWQASPVFRPNG